MTDSRVAAIGQALTMVLYPGIDRDIVSLGYIKDISMEGERVQVRVELSASAEKDSDEIRRRIESALAGLAIPYDVSLSVLRPAAPPEAPKPPDPLGYIPYKIAVSSGKGGVGKSTVAVNLAVALAKLGFRVGLLDTDIYGPSVPVMLGLEDQEPQLDPESKKLIPLERYGVQNISIGYLVDRHTPVVWRGPMMSKAIDQLMRDVDWSGIEVLLFDLPPGTGDIQLSLSQKIDLTGALIVSTPQDVALIDAVRGAIMFEKVSVPILGLLENMSYFVCDQCDKRHYIFGSGGGKREAEQLGIPFLSEIPIDAEIGVGGDNGTPIVEKDPEAPASVAFLTLAKKLAEEVLGGARK